MKPYILLLLVGMMMGQEKATKAGPLVFQAIACIQVIAYKDQSKQVRDIFPEECGGRPSATAIGTEVLHMQPIQTYPLMPPSRAGESSLVVNEDGDYVCSTNGEPYKVCTKSEMYSGLRIEPPQPAEAPEVPAIKKDVSYHPPLCISGQWPNCQIFMEQYPEDWKPPIEWTCKNKARILDHDENSPPKYWCRKVQTE